MAFGQTPGIIMGGTEFLAQAHQNRINLEQAIRQQRFDAMMRWAAQKFAQDNAAKEALKARQWGLGEKLGGWVLNLASRGLGGTGQLGKNVAQGSTPNAPSNVSNLSSVIGSMNRSGGTSNVELMGLIDSMNQPSWG